MRKKVSITAASKAPAVTLTALEHRILLLRGQKLLLSSDLAALYEVEARVLNQAVARNRERFPEDFMFALTAEEYANLKSQNVTSSWGGARRAPPYAFTEQGVAMLSSLLRSERAVQVNIAITRLRQAPGDAGQPSRTRREAGPHGAKIRPAIQGRVRCHPRAHGTACQAQDQDWLLTFTTNQVAATAPDQSFKI